MPAVSPAQKRLMEAAAHTPGGYGGVPQSVGKEFVSKDNGKLNEKERDEADKDHAAREEMPATAFLEGESRKYPVKTKQDGEWKYDRDLLLAAEREAEMHGHQDLAAKAKRIREHLDSLASDGKISEGLALDRASMRRTDADGRLHVAITNISKATVNPYYGREIPNWQGLGLDPDRVYQLLRDPVELEKGASTFNNIPLLSKHVPVSADEPMKHLVVGATGTDAEFVAPYLRNSLVVWDAVAIAGIESQEQQELSCAYRYVPVMTPGTFDGMAYDGVMTQIVGNHVALVEVGRAGPDVVVSDSNSIVEQPMKKKPNGKTVAVRAAIRAYLRPMIAADAAIDIKAIVGDVTGGTVTQDAERIAKTLKSKVGQADENRLKMLVMDAAKDEENDEVEDEDETEEEKKKREAKEKKAEDEDDDEKDKKAEDDEKDGDGPEHKKAMDAAIAAARADAEKGAIAKMQAIQQAEKDVRPIIGEVSAMDSAEAIYKLALDQLGVDVTGVHPSAYSAMVKMHATHSTKPKLAHDAANAGWMESTFKGIKLPTRA